MSGRILDAHRNVTKRQLEATERQRRLLNAAALVPMAVAAGINSQPITTTEVHPDASEPPPDSLQSVLKQAMDKVAVGVEEAKNFDVKGTLEFLRDNIWNSSLRPSIAKAGRWLADNILSSIWPPTQKSSPDN